MDPKETRLHLGCGGMKLPGFTNIDLYPSSATDEVWDVSDINEYKRYKPGTVEEIVSFHLVEHLQPGRMTALATVWHGILKPGGRLIIETPDLHAVAREYAQHAANPLMDARVDRLLHYIYGSKDGDGQDHFWGWDRRQLKRLLAPLGFAVSFEEPQDYHAQEAPCLRLKAIKK